MNRGSSNAVALPMALLVIVALTAGLLYSQRKHHAEQAVLEAEYQRLNSWHDPAQQAFEKIKPDLSALTKYDWKNAKDASDVDAILARILAGADEMKRHVGPQGAGHALPERVDAMLRQYNRLGLDLELPFKLDDPVNRARLAMAVWDQMPEAQHHKMTTPAENVAWRNSLVEKATNLDDATLRKMYLLSHNVEEEKQYYKLLDKGDDLDRLLRIPPIVPSGLERKDAAVWK